MESNRTCPVCSIEYYADPQRLKHGRQTTCSRFCSYKLRAKKHTKAPEDRFDTKAYNRRYYQEHSESIKAHVKNYKKTTNYRYVLNEEQKEYSRQRALEWYRAHKDVVILRSKLWKKAHPDKVNAGSRSYASRRRGALGNFTPKDFIKLKNRQDGKCAYCMVNEANSIDHIVPLSKGGSNFIGNILPVCGYCNSSKSSKTLYEWKVSSGRILSI